MIPGCASVDPKPFEKFYASVSEFQSGTDEALELVRGLAKAGFSKPSPLSGKITFDSVVLTFDEDPTRPVMDAAPLFAQLRKLRRGAFALNAALTEYTQFLALLAGGSEKDAEDLENLAKRANANLRSARDATGVGGSDKEVALVATIGVKLLREKIERDRANYLRETMDAAGSPAGESTDLPPKVIDEFSEFMVVTMDIVATDVMSLYTVWVDLQRRDYNAASGEDQKRKIIVTVLERNDRTQLLLETIRTLREGYRMMPAAHREVRKSLDEKEPFLASVTRLYGDAKRLQKLHKELTKAESQ
jgi:hypothetical protein